MKPLEFSYKIGSINGTVSARSPKEAKRKALAEYVTFSVDTVDCDVQLSFATPEPFMLKEELEYRIQNNLGTEADLLTLSELQEIINQLHKTND